MTIDFVIIPDVLLLEKTKSVHLLRKAGPVLIIMKVYLFGICLHLVHKIRVLKESPLKILGLHFVCRCRNSQGALFVSCYNICTASFQDCSSIVPTLSSNDLVVLLNLHMSQRTLEGVLDLIQRVGLLMLSSPYSVGSHMRHAGKHRRPVHCWPGDTFG